MFLSIIIPVYNREKLIVEALTSVMKQNWRPVEIIVVDDGSTDATASVVEDFVKITKDEGVLIRILRQQNRGSAAARNAGIGMANGDCLLFLDSDDVLTRVGLASLVDVMMADNSLDFTYGKISISDENLNESEESVGINDDDVLNDPVTYHWSAMAALYRNSIVTACGGWGKIPNGSDDWVFQSRIKLVARKAKFVDVTVGIWRQHPDERICTTSFRESYTVDVTKSCLAIFRQWLSAGRLTPRIHRRLYCRALRHCWELGSFGSRAERKDAFFRIREIGQGSMILKLLALLLERLPIMVDRVFYCLVNKIKPSYVRKS